MLRRTEKGIYCLRASGYRCQVINIHHPMKPGSRLGLGRDRMRTSWVGPQAWDPAPAGLSDKC